MKFNQLSAISTATAIVIAGTLSFSDRASATDASTIRFICGSWRGSQATLAMTERHQLVPVILWDSNYFNDSGFDSTTRCQVVSDRFQTYYDRGKLNYITTGRMNRLPVVCVAETWGGPCSDVLFTLKPGSDPIQTLQDLIAIRIRSQGPLNETQPRLYVDFQQYLKEAAIDRRDRPTSATDNRPSPLPTRALW
jgi:hypothetical protein